MIWTATVLSIAFPAHGQMLADGIAAVVNNKVITYVQINQQVSENEKLLRQHFQGEELFEQVKEAKLGILKSLIDRELILQQFKDDMKGNIPDTYINAEVDRAIREQYGGDRVAFIKTLYERGVTMKQYREDIENSIIIRFMREKNIVQTILVSPYQIEQFYQQNLRLFQQDEQIKVSTIVLRKSSTLSEKTGPDGKTISYDPQLEIAKEILYKLDTGSDFGELAKSYSEGSNKSDGGALGWVTQSGKSAIRSDLWPALAKLQPGQHTDVIATTDGFYYILQVEDRKKFAVTPLEDVRGQIEQTVIGQRTQLRQQEWLDSLRNKAFIKMFL